MSDEKGNPEVVDLDECYPTQKFRLPGVGLRYLFSALFHYWHWPTCAVTLGLTAIGLSSTALLTKKAPPPTPTSFQVAPIAGCQFIIFSNPFYILHHPQCPSHGPHGAPTSAPVERPANMPAP